MSASRAAGTDYIPQWSPEGQETRGNSRPPLKLYRREDLLIEEEEDWWGDFEQPRTVPKSRTNRGKVPALIVCGLVSVVCAALLITQLSGISARAKRISAINSEMQELESQKTNLEVELSVASDIVRVRDRAISDLNMVQPDIGQIKVVTLPEELSGLQTHTASVGDAENVGQ